MGGGKDEAEEKAKVAKIGEEELIEKKELVKELSCAPDETGKMHCTTPGAFELEETKHSKHSRSKRSHSKHSSKHSSKDRHEDRAPSHHRSEEDPEAKEPNPRDGKSTAAEMIEMIEADDAKRPSPIPHATHPDWNQTAWEEEDADIVGAWVEERGREFATEPRGDPLDVAKNVYFKYKEAIKNSPILGDPEYIREDEEAKAKSVMWLAQSEKSETEEIEPIQHKHKKVTAKQMIDRLEKTERHRHEGYLDAEQELMMEEKTDVDGSDVMQVVHRPDRLDGGGGRVRDGFHRVHRAPPGQQARRPPVRTVRFPQRTQASPRLRIYSYVKQAINTCALSPSAGVPGALPVLLLLTHRFLAGVQRSLHGTLLLFFVPLVRRRRLFPRRLRRLRRRRLRLLSRHHRVRLRSLEPRHDVAVRRPLRAARVETVHGLEPPQLQGSSLPRGPAPLHVALILLVRAVHVAALAAPPLAVV